MTWNATVALASGLAIQLALLMTGVAFTRSLTVSDRGYFALLTLFPAILFQVIALGAPSAVAFFGANEDGARHARGKTILKLVGLQALACLALHVVLLLAYLPHAPTSIYPAALLSLVISPLALARRARGMGPFSWRFTRRGWGSYFWPGPGMCRHGIPWRFVLRIIAFRACHKGHVHF
jgi:hypothetical protein